MHEQVNADGRDRMEVMQDVQYLHTRNTRNPINHDITHDTVFIRGVERGILKQRTLE